MNHRLVINLRQTQRRENLARLVAERGAQSRLAEMLDVEPNYISRMVVGTKPIGERTAARIEDMLHLAPRTLDEPAAPVQPLSGERSRSGPNGGFVYLTSDEVHRLEMLYWALRSSQQHPGPREVLATVIQQVRG